MNRSFALLIFAFYLSLGQIARAQKNPALEAALRPLAEGVPEIAAERLRALPVENLSPEERIIAQRALGQALTESGRAADALKVLADPRLTSDPRAIFWRAQAFAALERWAEALTTYQAAANPSSSWQADANFGTAQALRALGRKEEALRVLLPLEENPKWTIRAKLGAAELLIDRGDLEGAAHRLRETKPQLAVDRNQKRFLFGRLNLAQGHFDKAIETLGVILQKPEGVPHPLLVATLLAVADAHLRGKTPESGDDPLEDFIEHQPTDPALPEIFAKLDALYRAEEKSSRNELKRWIRDPAQPRRALAQWYFGRSQLRAGERDAAIATLAQLRESTVRLPSLGEANLELARLQLDDRKWDAAIASAEAARTQNPLPPFSQRVDWLIAEADYRADRLEKAAPIFERIAEQTPELAHAALFNAALCWLRLNRTEQYSADYRRISNDPTNSAAQGELLLEEGTMQAAQNKPEAARSFQDFIRKYPKSGRLSEAWVALAELAFHAPKPDLDAARQDLARARQANPTPAASERADYLEIWIEDASSPNDEARVIETANRFLQQHAASRLAPEVRMKLAEAYFRRQDFANAQTQFELLAQLDAKAPLAEKALFFAARSSMSSMRSDSLDHALALLDQVVQLNGEMKWAARNEEAAVERRLGKNQEALALYNEVLKNDAKAPEKREALCGKGDIYYEMGAADPQNYRQAVELFRQLATEPGVPAHWRNQAAFKEGKSLEKLSDIQGALATYYGVIEGGARPDLQHEFFWFYKAGFNAAHLLEEAQDWKSAAAVYRQLAAIGGTRSEEAKTRLTQLRLEHFLWEE